MPKGKRVSVETIIHTLRDIEIYHDPTTQFIGISTTRTGSDLAKSFKNCLHYVPALLEGKL